MPEIGGSPEFWARVGGQGVEEHAAEGVEEEVCEEGGDSVEGEVR